MCGERRLTERHRATRMWRRGELMKKRRWATMAWENSCSNEAALTGFHDMPVRAMRAIASRWASSSCLDVAPAST